MESILGALMIKISVPALESRDLVLDSITTVRGKPESDIVPPLEGRIALGGPVSRHLTAHSVASDPSAADFLVEHSAHYAFHLVFFNLSFSAKPTVPRLLSVSLELSLSTPVSTPDPIALSMSPQRIVNFAQVEHGFRLGPELTFAGVEATLGEVSRSATWVEQSIFLQAMRQLRPDPGWEFRRTKTMDIAGSYDLAMVVRSPKNAATGITCTVTATTKGGLLNRYRRELPEPLLLETVI